MTERREARLRKFTREVIASEICDGETVLKLAFEEANDDEELEIVDDEAGRIVKLILGKKR